MEPVQVKALAHKIWIAEFRITDLLTQVHPEKWKTSNVTRNSFNQTLGNLHKALEGLEEWRAQFEKRPDSMYFGFQTYAGMNAALPRLDGVARAASQFENPSLARSTARPATNSLTCNRRFNHMSLISCAILTSSFMGANQLGRMPE